MHVESASATATADEACEQGPSWSRRAPDQIGGQGAWAATLGEFCCAVTSRRRAVPLTHDVAIAWVQLWKRHDVREIAVPHVDLALELSARCQVGCQDALVVAAAHLAGCEVVYSGDLNDGQKYDGVRVENPF